MVDGDRARIWAARLLAPIAFFGAATILVVVVQRSLDAEETRPPEPVPLATSVPAPETGAAETSPAGPSEQPRTYRVRPGDTLESIAARFDTTVVDLFDLNPDIDPLALSPGQRIRIR